MAVDPSRSDHATADRPKIAVTAAKESSEFIPLFQSLSLGAASVSSDEELGRSRRDECEEPCRESNQSDILFDELWGMNNLAVPVIGTYLLEMLPGLVSIILVGHIHGDQTEEYIDATALAVMFMNLTGLSIGIGLCTALDTLCSQAFGAKETERMGTYLQTGVLVLVSFYVVVCILFYHCADLLFGLGQPAAVSRLAGTFTLYLLPGIPFLFLYELLRKVLQAQNIAAPMFYVAALANAVNVGVGYWLVYHTSWGWLGAALARTACNLSFFLFLLPYTVSSGLGDTFWTGLHLREAVRGIPEFLALGVPGMLQLCFEWWAFEILSLLCGLLPNAVVAIGANAVILNISSMVYMPYLGLSVSCNVRVGNALGAGDPKRASVAAKLTIGIGAATALVCAALLLVFRTVLPHLFTHDEDINRLASVLICVSAAFQIPDSINAAVQGVFRGSGRQTLGAKLNFVAYYLLGIPLGCLIAFGLKLGTIGLWVGMTAGLLLVAVSGTMLISRSDWAMLAKQAETRVKRF